MVVASMSGINLGVSGDLFGWPSSNSHSVPMSWCAIFIAFSDTVIADPAAV